MPMYETMLVTGAALDAEATAALVAKFRALIEANGTVDAVDEWGKRRLAYPIGKAEEGVYTLIHFTAGESFPAELDRVYKITDGVMRSLIIAKDEAMEAARVAAAAKAEAAKAQAAEAEAARREAARAAEAAKAQAAETAETDKAAAADDTAEAQPEAEAEQREGE